MTRGPSIVFTKRAVANETFFRKSNNLCKAFVGIDACQLYPYSMSQFLSFKVVIEVLFLAVTDQVL